MCHSQGCCGASAHPRDRQLQGSFNSMELDHLQPRDSAWQPEPGSLPSGTLWAPWAAQSGPRAHRVCFGKDTGSQDGLCLGLAASRFCLLALCCPTHPSASWEWSLTVLLPGGKPRVSALDADIPWRWDVVSLLLLQDMPMPLAFRRNFWTGQAPTLQSVSDTSDPWVVGNQNAKCYWDW